MEEKHFHLITDEDKILELKMNYHNEIVILLKGKELSNVHILNIERSSFPKENDILQTENEIIQFIKSVNEKVKNGQYEVFLLSEKILKSQIDYIREIVNYSKIFLFEYGDIFYPSQTMNMKDKIEIKYQIKPSILQVSGYPSQYTKRKIYHIFYDGLWNEVSMSIV